jgi:hypothetical protein
LIRRQGEPCSVSAAPAAPCFFAIGGREESSFTGKSRTLGYAHGRDGDGGRRGESGQRFPHGVTSMSAPHDLKTRPLFQVFHAPARGPKENPAAGPILCGGVPAPLNSEVTVAAAETTLPAVPCSSYSKATRDTSCRMPWSAGYITNTFESEFSAHTGVKCWDKRIRSPTQRDQACCRYMNEMTLCELLAERDGPCRSISFNSVSAIAGCQTRKALNCRTDRRAG